MLAQIKNAANFPWDYFRGLRALQSNSQQNDGQTSNGRFVVLDFRTNQLLFDAGRYLYALVEAFRQANCGVLVSNHRRFTAFAGHKYFGRAALALPNVTGEWLRSSRETTLGRISDHDPTCASVIFGDTRIADGEIFPYPMHPRSYVSLNRVRSLGGIRHRRSVPSHARILFSGNFNHKYDRHSLESKFGVVSRVKMIEFLKDEFRSIIPQQQESFSQIQALLDTSEQPTLVINHSKTCAIPYEFWLEALSRIDFFLCCPGVANPFCHNAIEAMSVGTIPIIEFPELFSPPLQDGVNAITFRGLDGLSAAVDRALKLPAEQRNQMSQQVAEYYQQYLCIRRFVEQWLSGGANAAIHFPYIEGSARGNIQRSGHVEAEPRRKCA